MFLTTGITARICQSVYVLSMVKDHVLGLGCTCWVAPPAAPGRRCLGGRLSAWLCPTPGQRTGASKKKLQHVVMVRDVMILLDHMVVLRGFGGTFIVPQRDCMLFGCARCEVHPLPSHHVVYSQQKHAGRTCTWTVKQLELRLTHNLT